MNWPQMGVETLRLLNLASGIMPNPDTAYGSDLEVVFQGIDGGFY